MVQKKEEITNGKKAGLREAEEYPEPLKEHAYELKIDKRQKRMLEELEEKEVEKIPLEVSNHFDLAAVRHRD